MKKIYYILLLPLMLIIGIVIGQGVSNVGQEDFDIVNEEIDVGLSPEVKQRLSAAKVEAYWESKIEITNDEKVIGYFCVNGDCEPYTLINDFDIDRVYCVTWGVSATGNEKCTEQANYTWKELKDKNQKEKAKDILNRVDKNIQAKTVTTVQTGNKTVSFK